MNRIPTLLIAAVSVPLVSAVLYVGAPFLGDSRTALRAEVDVAVERARRLLHQYDANAERLGDILDGLAADQVEVTPAGDAVQSLLEEHRSLLEEADEQLRVRARAGDASFHRELEERYRTAGGRGEEWTPPGSLGANIGSLVRSAREGLAARDAILAENERLLEDALAAVNEAISLTKDDASGADHVNAQRMKGLILRSKGASFQRAAQRLRFESSETRTALARQAIRAGRLRAGQNLIETSQVHQKIDELQGQIDQLRRETESRRARLQQLDDRITGLQQGIQKAEKAATAAQQTMTRLTEEGVDLLSADGFEMFATRFSEAAQAYGLARIEEHNLKSGALIGARIDDSGDYLRGAFVPQDPSRPIVEQRGIDAYQQDRQTLAAEVEGYAAALSEMEHAKADLEALAQRYAGRVVEEQQETNRLRQEATTTYERFRQNADQIDATVERALRSLGDAIAALRIADRLAVDRGRQAGETIAGRSPAAQDRSALKVLSEDQTLAGQITNDLAQVQYLLGSVYYDRFSWADADYQLIVHVKDVLGLSDADAGLFQTRRDAALENGRTATAEAVASFERSSRALQSHWTVAAQAGDAHYLLSRFEESPTPFINSAIENFIQAVGERRDRPHSEAIVRRLAQLGAQ